MTSATVGSVTTDMVYRGGGLRDSRTVDEDTVTFTWDLAQGPPQVIDDGSLAYVYGLGRISQVAADDTTHYYLGDALGSTMALTDADGDVVNTYDYDVFGSVRSSTGSQPNEFRFTGEQWDDANGLEYLRARYYDPAIGRFLSRDPVVQDVNDPQALNAYSYVRNDPLVYVDPTGMYVDPIVPQAPFPSLGLGGAASSGPDIPNLVLSYVDCALNGDCAGAGMTQEAAQALIANPSFWEISFHDYNALNDMFWGVVDLLLEGGMTEERMALIPEAGWREMARNWRVTPGFLRASLFDLVYGNAVKTSELGARDIVGAYPWWHYVYDSGDPVAVIRMMLLADKYHFDWVHNGEAIETVLAYMTITLWYFLGPNPPTPLPWSTWQIAEVLAIERGPPNSQKACLSGTGLEVRTVNPSSSSAGPGAACN